MIDRYWTCPKAQGHELTPSALENHGVETVNGHHEKLISSYVRSCRGSGGEESGGVKREQGFLLRRSRPYFRKNFALTSELLGASSGCHPLVTLSPVSGKMPGMDR